MPDTFKVEGKTLENSVAAENIVIAYKANRNDPGTVGEELDRTTADTDGNFKLTFDDWPHNVAVMAIDPTDTVAYDSKIVDWVTPTLDGYDPFYGNVVALLRMEGADGANSFIDEIGNLTTVSYGLVTTSVDQVKFGSTAAKFIDTDPDSRLESTHNGELDLGPNEFCIEFFFFANTLSGTMLLLTDRLEDDPIYNYLIYTEGSKLRYYFQTDVDGPIYSGDSGSLSVSTWYHVAIVRDGNTIRCFLDGVQQTTLALTNYSSAPDPGNPIVFGYDPNVLSRNWDGYIDSFRMTVGTPRYTENFAALTEDYPVDVDGHFYQVTFLSHFDGADQGTTFTDVKGGTMVAEGGAITSTTQSKFGSTALYVPNASSRVRVDDSPLLDIGAGDWTLEAWVYQNGDSWNKPVFCKRNSSANYAQYLVRVRSDEGIEIYLNKGGSWNHIYSAANAVPNNEWAHIAFTRHGDTVRGFVNGTQVCGDTIDFDPVATSDNLYIGSEVTTNAGRLIGYIDDARITVGYARYTADFTPRNAPFQDQ